ncbi:myosin-binding protein H-like isoform X4 [Fukomys damarensis]|uniref:myosin-binding protein H-like isoform X4 n=1 Tax=Fukomys damarensis TaxID=885580 RepID=UPI001455515E|nr:myosin-binding protein H-like isoform X4 [Fukomys damarensis]XP_033614291.1 myosin-binding protein H-like isoform X4 [Fukomys damarensis]
MVETVLCVYASRLTQGQSRLGLEVCPAQPSLLELTGEHTGQVLPSWRIAVEEQQCESPWMGPLLHPLFPPWADNPKIRLPRALRQTYIRKVGDTVNLLIPFQGKPKPQAIWTHDGRALDTSRVSVRNGEQDSILFIREAQRADSGCYQLCVQLGGLEATVTVNILVIERPGPPQSIKLVDVWGSNATLEWTAPLDTGNTALLGYTVQKADTKSGLWFTVLEHYHRTSCIVSDLIVGNSYAFRVLAENQCGLSETAPVTADLAHIQKAVTVYKSKRFAQRDFSEAPKFTQPLADCTTITGYDTQLFCCVRASPKLLIETARKDTVPEKVGDRNPT